VVVHGQMGLLVEDENVKALADAIIFLLKNLTTATQISQAGRSRALEHFSWDRYVDAFDAPCRRLITGAQTETVPPR